MSKTLTLAADMTGLPLSLRNNGSNSLSIPSGTVVTFPDANSNDALAEMVSICGRQALYDNLAVLNYTLVNGLSADAITYGDFAQKTTTSLGVIPTIVSATVENVAADTIVLTMSADMVSAGNDYKTGFSCTVAGVARVISSATRQSTHSIIKFVMASAATNGQAIRLSYATNQYSQAAKTGSDLAAATGAYLPAFTNQVVTNNVL